jgi:GNAT superfamily N-acetyltransferase
VAHPAFVVSRPLMDPDEAPGPPDPIGWAHRAPEGEADEPCGYLLGRLERHDGLRPGVVAADLESMFVLPGARSAGVGAGLVVAFREWARGCGANLLTVTAYAGNAGARDFYRREGFVEHKVVMESPSV